MSREWFYYDPSGKKRGPVNQANILELVEARIIQRDTILESDGKRLSAEQVKGIVFPPDFDSSNPIPMPPPMPIDTARSKMTDKNPVATPRAVSDSGGFVELNMISTIFSVIGTFVLVVILVFMVKQSLNNPSPKAKQYEYQIVAPSDFSAEIELNRLGHEGWQVVSARRAVSSSEKSASYEMIIMREKR